MDSTRWHLKCWRLSVVALLLATFVAPTPAAASSSPENFYVALGDSYAAGPLIPYATGNPAACLRSTSNYPRILAAWYGVSDFVDASCTSAETKNMTEPQPVYHGVNPPQLDALRPTTRYVTLQIGGNDVGLSSIIRDCLTLDIETTPCLDAFVVDGVDELSGRIAQVGVRVDGILQQIATRSPDARVFVVGYPALLPDSGPGCWPVLPFSPDDTRYMSDKVKELNSALESAAAAQGATFVDVYTASIGRDPCAHPSARWVEPLIPATSAAPVHPNLRGMIGIAVMVALAINSSG